MNTYEAKIKGIKEDLSDGKISMVARKYIVTDAVTCGIAENKACIASHKDLSDITCTSVTAKTISEIINPNADRLWYVKIQMAYFDALTDKEKKTSYTYLIGAESAKHASDILMKHLEEVICSKEIVKISDSKVDFVISAE